MSPKKDGICKRIAYKCRSSLTKIFLSTPPGPLTPETASVSMSTAPTTTTMTSNNHKLNTCVDSLPGTLPSGGPIELPDEPDRSLKCCTMKEIAAHISHLTRLLATAINTRDLGNDSFIWEIFHPDFRFQQDEHLPEFSVPLLEHNARMRSVLNADPEFWCKVEGSEDVRPLRLAGSPADPAGEEEVEMLVKAQMVSFGISTVQHVVTRWRYESTGRRWRYVKGVGASDMMSGMPDY